MEFKVYQKELELQSRGWIPTFHDVSKEIMEIVAASGVKNGTVCIASHHTTCSVMIQECSHDFDTFDL
ncbi:MAG: YjbQ family protein, partial [Clostridia bacterium]|nr:YjbQ family protein [Clostridia bacterium]